jgi:excisionase family DNA binding protein
MKKTEFAKTTETVTLGVGSPFPLVNGDELTFTASTPQVRAFLERVSAASQDMRVGVPELTRLVWGPENPLMDTKILPGRAMATESTYNDPAFRLMLDLISRKRIAVGTLDIEAAVARYTLTVPEAAERLGIHQTSIRQAIKSGKLAAWKNGGTFFLDPASVESYRVSKRGARATWRHPLSVRFGTQGDAMFLVKWKVFDIDDADHLLANRVKLADGTQEGVIPQWGVAVVLTGIKSKGSYRCFELTPIDDDRNFTDEIEFQGFYVRGLFKQMKTNNSKEAMEKWDAFGHE